LIRYLREGRCVLFAGSGLSAWGKLPTWKGLLEDIVKGIRDDEPDNRDLPELDQLLKLEKLLDIADYCKEKLGGRYNEILSERVRGDAGEIPETHRIITQLPFAAVVTTNYDKLLERAYAENSSWPKTPTHLDAASLGTLLFDGSFFILKAHGDIDRPDTLVLTRRDYREIIHSNPAISSIFSAILLTKAILFVGYSLNDPDFRLLLDRPLTTFKGDIPERYSLMSGVGSVEQDVLWRTARIRIIPYPEGQHTDVLDFLSTLRDELASGKSTSVTAPPQATIAPSPTTGATKGATVKSTTTRSATTPTPQTARVGSDSPDATATASLSIRLRGQEMEFEFGVGNKSVKGRGQPPDRVALATQLRELLMDFSDTVSQQEVGRMLAQCFPAEVSDAITALPAAQSITLRLAAEVEHLPWEMTFFNDEFLALRSPLVRAPVGISDKARGYPLVREPVRVLLIGDPNQGDSGIGSLPGALAETQEIKAVYRNRSAVECTTLIGPKATFDNVVREFLDGSGYDVVHFAGHAWFDAQESYLMLHNQVVLRAHELRSLLSPHPPAILFLNTHFTSFVPPGVRTEETQATKRKRGNATAGLNFVGRGGFTEVASTTGVGALIGCFGSPLDEVARMVGVNVHLELLKGTPVADALYKARLNTLGLYDNNHNSLLYSLSGYGELTLPRTSPHINSTQKPTAAKKRGAAKKAAKQSSKKKPRK
jgi:hypothetical protein